MTRRSPKPPAIRDAFTRAKNGADILATLEAKTKPITARLRGAQLDGSLKILHQACTALDAGSPELAVLGFRASIESAGYSALTRVKKRRGGYWEYLPRTVGGRVRKVEFAEILQGMRDRKLDTMLAEGARIVQVHGNAVAHEVSKVDLKADAVGREALERWGPPELEEDNFLLVPLDIPSESAALEDARTAARILLLICRIMSRPPRRRRDGRGTATTAMPSTRP